MQKFSIVLPWDSANGSEEQKWVSTVLDLMQKKDKQTDDYSRWLSKLRLESHQFENLGFTVDCFDDLCISSEEPEGDVDNAALFIAAFLERWRPNRAVKLLFETTDVKGRVTKKALLIGPRGIERVLAVKKGNFITRGPRGSSS